MREELKSYLEFLEVLEVKIHEWQSKNIDDINIEKDSEESKSEIPQQKKQSLCLIF